MSLLIRNGIVLTMNDAYDIVRGDVWIEGGRIAAVGSGLFGTKAVPNRPDPTPTTTIDAEGGLVLPGFIQTHIHLCQTLFRGSADDLPLLAWLRERIWPLEAAHDASTLRAAARLAAAELLMGGTTGVLTMETVHDTEAVFEALEPTGLRAVVGKCLMDVRGDAPSRLYQPAREALDESLALHRRWHGAADGRLRAALAPRFAISCSRDLLEATAHASSQHGLLVHTHASEQREEVDRPRLDRAGQCRVPRLCGTGDRTAVRGALCLGHGRRTASARRAVDQGAALPRVESQTGSGVAPVTAMRARGISVSLGADGAACNNALDMFQEMRLAATLQAMRHGPGALTARDAVWMATREGARALGQDPELGSIEPGKLADIIVVRGDGLHQQPASNPYSTLVYASRATDVRATIVGGTIVYRDGALSWGEPRAIAEDAEVARRTLRERAGV